MFDWIVSTSLKITDKKFLKKLPTTLVTVMDKWHFIFKINFPVIPENQVIVFLKLDL